MWASCAFTLSHFCNSSELLRLTRVLFGNDKEPTQQSRLFVYMGLKEARTRQQVMVGRGRGGALGVRLCDKLRYPDAEDENRNQRGRSTNACADGLDEVDATNDPIVLFLYGWESAFTKEKLVGFMLRELPAIDHQTDEGSDENTPNDGHYR